MAAKAILVLCASALFVQSISACGCGNSGWSYSGSGNGGLSCGAGLGHGSGLGYGFGLGYGSGLGYSGSGGGLPVTTVSAIAPSGLSVRSENGIEGTMCVDGALPVLSAVGLDGRFPTAGQSGVQYSCGNGAGAGTGWGDGAGWANGAGILNGNDGCGCGC